MTYYFSSQDDFFYKNFALPSGMMRTGVSDQRILEVASNYDCIGITSIFSQQETQVLNCARLLKKNFPDKLLFSGGVNAKSRSEFFFQLALILFSHQNLKLLFKK